MDERWQRILRIMDEAFEEYLTGMAALRGRVVTDLKRKVSDSQVLDPPLWNSRQHRRGGLRGRGMACEGPPTSGLRFDGPARHVHTFEPRSVPAAHRPRSRARP